MCIMASVYAVRGLCWNAHGNEKIACEKKGIEEYERRRETQPFSGDAAVCFKVNNSRAWLVFHYGLDSATRQPQAKAHRTHEVEAFAVTHHAIPRSPPAH